jgi:hypothetical protein
MSKLTLWLLAPIMLGILYYNFRRDQQKTIQIRRRMLDECIGLLQNSKIEKTVSDFPRLSGQYAGYTVTLELILDTMAVRKVPPLWLTVDVEGKQVIKGCLDLVVRPQNCEFYSPSWEWEGNLKTPDNWPKHSIIKYQQDIASIEVLTQYVPSIFEDDHMKELLVLPSKLRITYLVKQAAKSEYMVLRNVLLDAKPIDKSQVELLIKKAIEIRESLEEEK